MNYQLTKSKYLRGTNCFKSLWLEVKNPAKGKHLSVSQKRIIDEGILVGEHAREVFQGGKMIDVDLDQLGSSISETQEALKSNEYIFEGIFIYDEILIKLDVLKKNGDGSWSLIEVKSTTKVKKEHISDLAIQKYVLINNGLNISSCKLMHINRECTFPVLSDLFLTEDVTDKVDSEMTFVHSQVAELKKYLSMEIEPERQIGDHCKKPNKCKFIDHCWEQYNGRTIFIIPRLSKKNKAELLSRNILLIDDIPDDIKLSDNQRQTANIIVNNTPIIDTNAIRKELASLNYPLYFLDFETLNPAVPRFDGMHPYEYISFQYSCFILDNQNKLHYNEFLAQDTKDPREDFTTSLISDLGNEGSIIVYNKTFEIGRLNDHKAWFPEYSEQIDQIINRIWDQLDIFKNYYQHPDFLGSNSLKDVLPIIVLDLSHKDLNIQEGNDAASIWDKMIREHNELKKKEMIYDLKEYCKRDSLAMVEIHKKLNELRRQT